VDGEQYPHPRAIAKRGARHVRDDQPWSTHGCQQAGRGRIAVHDVKLTRQLRDEERADGFSCHAPPISLVYVVRGLHLVLQYRVGPRSSSVAAAAGAGNLQDEA
jgi:hypothetical protein